MAVQPQAIYPHVFDATQLWAITREGVALYMASVEWVMPSCFEMAYLALGGRPNYAISPPSVSTPGIPPNTGPWVTWANAVLAWAEDQPPEVNTTPYTSWANAVLAWAQGKVNTGAWQSWAMQVQSWFQRGQACEAEYCGNKPATEYANCWWLHEAHCFESSYNPVPVPLTPSTSLPPMPPGAPSPPSVYPPPNPPNPTVPPAPTVGELAVMMAALGPPVVVAPPNFSLVRNDTGFDVSTSPQKVGHGAVYRRVAGDTAALAPWTIIATYPFTGVLYEMELPGVDEQAVFQHSGSSRITIVGGVGEVGPFVLDDPVGGVTVPPGPSLRGSFALGLAAAVVAGPAPEGWTPWASRLTGYENAAYVDYVGAVGQMPTYARHLGAWGVTAEVFLPAAAPPVTERAAAAALLAAATLASAGNIILTTWGQAVLSALASTSATVSTQAPARASIFAGASVSAVGGNAAPIGGAAALVGTATTQAFATTWGVGADIFVPTPPPGFWIRFGGAGLLATAGTTAIAGVPPVVWFGAVALLATAQAQVTGWLPNVYRDEIISSSPEAYWRLGEALGAATAVDFVGSHDGAYQSGTTLSAPGAIVGDADTCMQQAGSGGVVVPASAALLPATGWTFEAWVFLNTAMQQSVVDKWGDTTVGGFRLFLAVVDPSAPLWDLQIGDGSLPTTPVVVTPATVGVWTHLVATFDGMTGILYTDGVEAGSIPALYTNPESTPLQLGRGGYYSPTYGRIDEVAVYNRALSAIEVLDHYNKGVQEPGIPTPVEIWAKATLSALAITTALGTVAGISVMWGQAVLAGLASASGAGQIQAPAASTLTAGAGLSAIGGNTAPIGGASALVANAIAQAFATTWGAGDDIFVPLPSPGFWIRFGAAGLLATANCYVYAGVGSLHVGAAVVVAGAGAQAIAMVAKIGSAALPAIATMTAIGAIVSYGAPSLLATAQAQAVATVETNNWIGLAAYATVDAVATVLRVAVVDLRAAATASAIGDIQPKVYGRAYPTAGATAVAIGKVIVMGNAALSTVAACWSIARTLGYQVKLVEGHRGTGNPGVVVATLYDVQLEDPTWTLNEPGSCLLRIHTENAQAALITAQREVQVWRYGKLIWWGYPARVRSTPDITEVYCLSLLGYLSYRTVPPRQNILNHGWGAGVGEGRMSPLDAGWWVRWWRSSSIDVLTIRQEEKPVEDALMQAIDYTNKAVQGQTDYLQCRVQGWIIPERAEAYTIHVTTDDGVQVWFEGNLVISEWHANNHVTYSFTTPVLTAGQRYWVAIQHYNGTESQQLKVEWESASTVRQVIPGSRVVCLWGWDTYGLQGYEVDPAIYLSEPYGLRLKRNIGQSEDAFAWANVKYGMAAGETWVATGFVKVHEQFATDFAPAGTYQGRMLHLEDGPIGGGEARRWNAAEIEPNMKTGVWHYFSVGLTLGADPYLRLRLYTPGNVTWDEVTLVREQSMVAVGAQNLADFLVQKIQERPAPADSRPDLKFLTSRQSNGAIGNYVIPYDEHGNILDLLRTLSQVSPGFDYDVVPGADGSTRTCQFWDRRGSDKALTLTWGTHFVDYGAAEDLAGIATRVIALGAGSGAGRLEGAAEDASAYTYGWRDAVVQHAELQDPGSLRLRAAWEVAARHEPILTPDLPLALALSPTMFDQLAIGDRVGVSINHGRTQLAGQYRVVQIRLDPDKDVMALVVNPV